MLRFPVDEFVSVAVFLGFFSRRKASISNTDFAFLIAFHACMGVAREKGWFLIDASNKVMQHLTDPNTHGIITNGRFCLWQTIYPSNEI